MKIEYLVDIRLVRFSMKYRAHHRSGTERRNVAYLHIESRHGFEDS